MDLPPLQSKNTRSPDCGLLVDHFPLDLNQAACALVSANLPPMAGPAPAWLNTHDTNSSHHSDPGMPYQELNLFTLEYCPICDSARAMTELAVGWFVCCAGAGVVICSRIDPQSVD